MIINFFAKFNWILLKKSEVMHICQIGHFLDFHNPAYVFWTCPFLMCHFPEVYLWIYPFQGFIQALTDLILNWVLKLNPIKQEINSNKNYLDCLERALFILFTPFIETRPWTIASMEVLNEGERSKLVSKIFLLFDINMKKRRSSGNKVP